MPSPISNDLMGNAWKYSNFIGSDFDNDSMCLYWTIANFITYDHTFAFKHTWLEVWISAT